MWGAIPGAAADRVGRLDQMGARIVGRYSCRGVDLAHVSAGRVAEAADVFDALGYVRGFS